MAYKNCTNCGSAIHCSCEYQVASDGHQCCDNCIERYEMEIDLNKKIIIEDDTISNRISEQNNDEESQIL